MNDSFSLLDNSSGPDSDGELTINKNYAERYDVWRNKEELQKLKDLSKDVSDSSSESEEEVEPVIEKDFLKTLSLLKSKDPRIYDESVEFFTEEPVVKKPKVKKEKPMFMKDYERKLVMERNGVFSDDEEEEEYVPKGPSVVQEQEEIKKSFKAAIADSDEEDGDDLFQVRTKTKTEEDKEEADYKQWLETEKDMKHLNKVWNDPDLNDDERFLKDYILNKRYVVDDKLGEIPTYDEITNDMLSEDEKVIEQQELFEHKYNYRFEDPDEEFIKSYPRTVGDSLRREDNKRKRKREEYAERKKKEKEQKREELKRLKALKRKEIEEKFFKIKEASGQDQLNFDESDIESDFDPDKHDQKMREMFNEDYYNVEEEQKPQFGFDEELDGENWDHWSREQTDSAKPRKFQKEQEEEEDSSEDEDESKQDARSQFEQEMIDSMSDKKRRGRKKSLFAKIISEPKPLYDPDGKSFEEYLDEYYRLDYEDVVGDMPVRFKYRKVIPNDFGLSVEEILAAQDKELNRWCSVKKTCQYRRDEEEKYDVQAFQKKAQNMAAKKNILVSIYAPPEEKEVQVNADASNESAAKPKRKRKKKKKNVENSNSLEEDSSTNHDVALSRLENDQQIDQEEDELVNSMVSNEECVEPNRKKKKPKKKKKKNVQNLNGAEDDSHLNRDLPMSPLKNGLQSSDTSPSRNRKSSGLEEDQVEDSLTNASVPDERTAKPKRKKKKKPKKNLISSNDAEVQSNLDRDVDSSPSRNYPPSSTHIKFQAEEEDGEPAEAAVSNGEARPRKQKKKQTHPQEVESVVSDRKVLKPKHKKKQLHPEHDEQFVSDRKVTEPKHKKKQHHPEEEEDERVDSIVSNASVTKPKRKRKRSQLEQEEDERPQTLLSNENSSKPKHKKRRYDATHSPFKNDRKPFGKPSPHRQNFKSRTFFSGRKAQSNSAEQVLCSSGKKIVSSNTRLGAFQINPKKLKNSMMYSKKQT